MLHKRDLAGDIEVDGQNYEWELQREPQCTTNGSPQRQRPKVNDAVVINGVRAALAAGWEPTSRGKPIVYMVDANGC
ncbi:hypothetical protein EAH79_13750 [Sphingomonas koreensis]|nr:hypothetical protein EAH79_13750 [Sphingomonas koreensis]